MAQTVTFYTLDISYKVVDGLPEVHLFGKTTTGEHIIVVDPTFKPYFIVVPKKGASIEDKLKQLRSEHEGGVAEVTGTEQTTLNWMGKETLALKVYTKLPQDVPLIREIIKEWELIEGIYAYDILFVRRYMIDKQITPLVAIQATGEFIQRKGRGLTFMATAVSPASDDTLTTPSVLAFDLETYHPPQTGVNFDKFPILMVSLYAKNLRKVITWKKFEGAEDYVEFVDSESDLIQRFKELVEHVKPDIIAGYNSDGFDMPYIARRAKKYKISLDLGMDHSEIHVSARGVPKALITGMIHLDVFRVITKLFSQTLETDSYSLDAVSAELLGERKVSVDMISLYDIWDNHPDQLGPYAIYNLHDSHLVHRLVEKILPNITELVKIVGLPMADITRMGFSQLVEWYLIRQAAGFKEIVPNKPHYAEVQRRIQLSSEGAFVFEPRPGLYKHVAIFDFRSLYPSIISSHNISEATMNCSCCKDTAQKVPLDGKEWWYCTRRRGFLPQMIEQLITRRSRIKEMAKTDKNPFLEARSQGLKLLANSFYGYLGFSNARWYCFECVRSTTAFGRNYIHSVIDDARKEGFSVVYSDTDSIFLGLESRTIIDAQQLIERINQRLPGIMEIEYQGHYPAALFVSTKGTGAGAKKRYALLDDKGIVHIKGFEVVRRNFSTIGKEVQEHILTMLLKDQQPENAVAYLRKIIQDVRDKKIPSAKMVIKTQLTKTTGEYSATAPHVAIARRLEQKGIPVSPGQLITFIVAEGTGTVGNRARLPEEVIDNNYDPSYYIENQIVPAVERVFAVFGYTQDDLLSDKKQSKLGHFFS